MTDEMKKLLTDIEQAILNIDIHLQAKRNFTEFTENITIRRAVERELEIIGEATNNLLKTDAAFPLSHTRKVVDLRNRVIHAYDDVDETVIWKVIVTDIPVLLQEVQQLLTE